MTLKQKVVAFSLELLAVAAWVSMQVVAFGVVLVFASGPERVQHVAWYAICFALVWSLLPVAKSWAVWLIAPRYCLEFSTTRELHSLADDVRAVLERRTAARDAAAGDGECLDGLVPEGAIYRR